MDYIEPVNHAISYIEDNLTQTITIEDVAAKIGYSRFHFHRLFLTILGETPARYIRKRRLSEAACELVNSKRSVLNIALDYQFQSQEVFSRAFKKMFGFSPTAYRSRNHLTRVFRRVTLSRRKIFRLDDGIGTKLGIVIPRQKFGTSLPFGEVVATHTYAVFVYRKHTSVLERKLDAVQLLFL